MDVLDRSQLSPDTQATLLLCGRFDARPGARDELARPLSGAEYLRLAKALLVYGRRPADLMNGDLGRLASAGIAEDRLRALLARGMAMALALERWSRSGISVLGRGDPGYPASLRKRLRGAAPHLLFVCGPSGLLDTEALCVVGSRDATEDGLASARSLGRACAAAEVAVVSGGARGVDREATMSALESGGRAVGILADSLSRAVLSKDYRRFIANGRLTLASAGDPDARFSVAGAMERNKYLYALARAAVIVDSDVKGGTWSGAVENAEHGWVPAYVRLDGDQRPGNLRLADLGLAPLPGNAGDDAAWIREILDKAPPAAGTTRSLTQGALPLATSAGCMGEQSAGASGSLAREMAEELFDAFIGRALVLLDSKPRSARQIADHFAIEDAQARRWLDKAVERRIIRRDDGATGPIYCVPSRSAA